MAADQRCGPETLDLTDALAGQQGEGMEAALPGGVVTGRQGVGGLLHHLEEFQHGVGVAG